MALGPIINALGNSKGLQALSNIGFAQQAVSGLGDSAGKLVGAMTPGVASLKLFTVGLNLIQAPALALVNALKGMRDSVGALGSAVSEFVRLTNPVYVERFNLAMDDLTASIGKFLVPVLEFSIKLVRSFADVVFTLAGPLKNLVQAGFKPLTVIIDQILSAVSPLVRIAGSVISALTPFFSSFMTVATALSKLNFAVLESAFNLLEVALTPLLNLFEALGMILVDVANDTTKFIDSLLKMFGFTPGRGSIRDTSVGAAVRPATIGSVEEYGRKAQQAAFSLGTAADPAVRTADGVMEIYKFLTEGMWTRWRELLMEFINNLPGVREGRAAAEVARDPVGAAVEAGRRIEAVGRRIWDAIPDL